ncbi:MAG: hypothetical protein ACOYJD_06940 [Christensenellales bacterium]|jgi:hypothetical protein
MSQLNQMELQNLRHLIGAHETAHQKLQAYAEQAMDPEIKQYFQDCSQGAMQTKQQLLGFLS